MTLTLILAAAVWALVGVWIWSLLRVAGRADRRRPRP